MPTVSDFVLYGLLVSIAILLAVAILVMMRRSRHSPTEGRTIPAPVSPDYPEPEAPDLVVEEEEPQIDSVELYLEHLRASNRTVEALGGNEYLVTRDAWSLPATVELAQMSNFMGQHEDDYKPSMRLRFEYFADGSWRISDRGENAEALRKVTDRFRQEIDAFRPQVNDLQVALSLDGALSTEGSSYHGFEDSLRDICSAVIKMDDHWTRLIWENEGPLPFALSVKGKTFEYSGSGTGNRNNDAARELTGRFTLNTGALVVYFQHIGGVPVGNYTEEVRLVRDDPGVFDDPLTICSFKGAGSMCGMWRVAEGRWRDPHPGIPYHLEVKAGGDWESTVFQPDLGQSWGNFPHRFGVEGGAHVVGPFRTGPRPIRANIQHGGTGQFFLYFISLDGSHEFAPDYSERIGQLHLEEQELGLLPGKEYLMSGWGDGPWDVVLTEGY